MSLKKKINHFWKAFEEKEANLRLAFAKDEHIVVVEEWKNYIKDEFALESAIVSDGEFFELSFFPEQDTTLQIIAQALKDFAPASLIDFWIINPFRQPMDDAVFHAYIPLDNREFDYQNFSVDLAVDHDSKMVQLIVKGEVFVFLEEHQKMEIADQFLRYFMGDLYYSAYVQNVECESVVKVELQPYDEVLLQELIDHEKMITNISLEQLFEVLVYLVEGLEWPTFHKLTEIYQAYKLEEEKISEDVREDMVLVTTIHPLLMQEHFQKETTRASMFFDLGGEFGYIYFENKHQKEQNALFRQQLAQQLDDLLYPHKIAKTMGGAIGLQYSYIEFAIFDRILFQKALIKMKERLSFEIQYQPYL